MIVGGNVSQFVGDVVCHELTRYVNLFYRKFVFSSNDILSETFDLMLKVGDSKFYDTVFPKIIVDTVNYDAVVFATTPSVLDEARDPSGNIDLYAIDNDYLIYKGKNETCFDNSFFRNQKFITEKFNSRKFKNAY